MANPIYHVSLVSDWRAARGAGEYTMSSNGITLAEVGFIHCCYNNQIRGVLQRFYGDVTDHYGDQTRTAEVDRGHHRGQPIEGPQHGAQEQAVQGDADDQRQEQGAPHQTGGGKGQRQ